MNAVDYQIEIDKGAVWEHAFTWKDENGTPINLTGFTAKFQVRRSKASDDNIIELDESDGIDLGTTNGLIEVTISAARTNTIPFSSGYYVLEITAGSGNTYRLVNGKVIVNDGEAT